MTNDLTIPDDGGDGFDNAEIQNRIIRGRILKFVDGRLSVEDKPFPPDTKLVVQNCAQVAQLWECKMPVESFFIDRENPISKVDELNRNIPEDSWEPGLDGKPRAPWQLNAVVYLIDEESGATYTMINSTKGMHRAHDDLVSQVRTKRAIYRNPRVVPIVVIGSAIMPTPWGKKARPEFVIIGWKGVGDDGPQQPLLKPLKPLTAAEIVDDEIHDDLPTPLAKLEKLEKLPKAHQPKGDSAKNVKEFKRPESMPADPDDGFPF